MASIRHRALALAVVAMAILPASAALAAPASTHDPGPRPEVVRVTAPRDDGARALVVGAGLLLAVAFGVLAARAVPRGPRRVERRPGPAEAAPDEPGPPRIAPGAELLGPFRDSGYAQPRFLARLGDGRMIALTRLAYAVAEQIDGRRDAAEIATLAGSQIGRRMGEDDVRFLVRERLRPAGLLAGAPIADVRPATPVLSLMLRAAIVPERPIRAAAEALRHLFVPAVVVAVLAAFVALDVWLVAVHGLATGVHETAAHPAALLLILGLLIVSAAFHECGHAAACRYGGASPGSMGVGIYLVWPVFYNDITDSYRLGRAGRLRTDLGGLYFNAIAVLVAGGVYLVTGVEPLLAFVLVQQLQMLLQFAPWVRLDGYYVVSDLAGVPNLFAHVGSSLRGLVPGRGVAAHGRRLTRRASVFIRGWVLTAVPLLLAVLVVLALHAPSTLATLGASFRRVASSASSAFASADVVGGLWALVQLGMLVLPIIGITAVAVVLTQRLGRAAAARWTRLPRVALVALACFAAGTVIPLTLDTVHV
jgi:putative peptide zinc metalloprotease protein